MTTTLYAVVAALPIIAILIYRRLYNWRFKRFSHLPQYLPTSLLWGHLQHVGEAFKKLGDSRMHGGTVSSSRALFCVIKRLKCCTDYMFKILWEDAGRPQILPVDLRPINYSMVVITSHDVAEQVSKITKLFPTSVPKSPTLKGFVKLLGDRSIISEEVSCEI
jgi:hypothetical protein